MSAGDAIERSMEYGRGDWASFDEPKEKIMSEFLYLYRLSPDSLREMDSPQKMQVRREVDHLVQGPRGEKPHQEPRPPPRHLRRGGQGQARHRHRWSLRGVQGHYWWLLFDRSEGSGAGDTTGFRLSHPRARRICRGSSDPADVDRWYPTIISFVERRVGCMLPMTASSACPTSRALRTSFMIRYRTHIEIGPI